MERKLLHPVANFRHALGDYTASPSYSPPPPPSLPSIDTEIMSGVYNPGSIRAVFNRDETSPDLRSIFSQEFGGHSSVFASP